METAGRPNTQSVISEKEEPVDESLSSNVSSILSKYKNEQIDDQIYIANFQSSKDAVKRGTDIGTSNSFQFGAAPL